MSTPIPEIIYLQWYGDVDPDGTWDNPDINQVSWDERQIFDADIEYIRKETHETEVASLHSRLEQALAAKVELGATMHDRCQALHDAIDQAVMDLEAIKLCLHARDTDFAVTAIERLMAARGVA